MLKTILCSKSSIEEISSEIERERISLIVKATDEADFIAIKKLSSAMVIHASRYSAYRRMLIDSFTATRKEFESESILSTIVFSDYIDAATFIAGLSICSYDGVPYTLSVYSSVYTIQYNTSSIMSDPEEEIC